MYLMRNHDVWIYVRCANSDPRIAFDRLYDLIDEAAGHGFLVRGTSFDHCSGNTLKDRIGLRSMLDAVENGRIEAVMVRDLEQISRNSYILVGVIEILRQNDVYLITTECDLNAELITEERHLIALKKAEKYVDEALLNVGAAPLDLIGEDIKKVWSTLGEITGKVASEDIIDEIFSKFCVGK